MNLREIELHFLDLNEYLKGVNRNEHEFNENNLKLNINKYY